VKVKRVLSAALQTPRNPTHTAATRGGGCSVAESTQTIGPVDSLRKIGNQESNFERRYYISSRELTAEQLAVAVRGHWAVENRLHWVLDVSFGEDASTVRKDNASQTLSLLKKIVLNLIRLDTTDQKKTSLRLKRKAAAWNDDFRVKITGLIRL